MFAAVRVDGEAGGGDTGLLAGDERDIGDLSFGLGLSLAERVVGFTG